MRMVHLQMCFSLRINTECTKEIQLVEVSNSNL